jgi:hypothetical protein
MSDVRAHGIPPSNVHNALVECLSAANEVSRLLQVYARFYQMNSAPYLLSYATYIAANIYVHVLAQSSGFPEAAGSLQLCLNALKDHQHLYVAAKRALLIVQALMRRMHVSLADQDEGPRATGISSDHGESMQQSTETSSGTLVSTSHSHVPIEQGSIWLNAQPDSMQLPVGFDFDTALQNFMQEQDFGDNYINMSAL